jgi:hypothetical protein
MRTITLITLALTLGCSGKTENAVSSPGEDGAAGEGGEEGAPGEDGEDGAAGEDGEDGADGLPCWDLNGDGEPNPEEDINGDGAVDVEDCSSDAGDETGPGSDGIFLGDLGISSEEQAVYFCEHYDTVLGSLSITEWGADIDALSCLVEVTHGLSITYGVSTETPTTYALPNLERVGGDMRFNSDPYARAANFDSLESVASLSFDQFGWAAEIPTEISFPLLRETPGDGHTSYGLWIDNSTVEEPFFPMLEEINGTLYVNYNSELSSLDGFESLNTVTGDFWIHNNASLCIDFATELAERVDIGGLTQTGGNTGPCP